jgi:hypothetical protein
MDGDFKHVADFYYYQETVAEYSCRLGRLEAGFLDNKSTLDAISRVGVTANCRQGYSVQG